MARPLLSTTRKPAKRPGPREAGKQSGRFHVAVSMWEGHFVFLDGDTPAPSLEPLHAREASAHRAGTVPEPVPALSALPVLLGARAEQSRARARGTDCMIWCIVPPPTEWQHTSEMRLAPRVCLRGQTLYELVHLAPSLECIGTFPITK